MNIKHQNIWSEVLQTERQFSLHTKFETTPARTELIKPVDDAAELRSKNGEKQSRETLKESRKTVGGG